MEHNSSPEVLLNAVGVRQSVAINISCWRQSHNSKRLIISISKAKGNGQEET